MAMNSREIPTKQANLEQAQYNWVSEKNIFPVEAEGQHPEAIAQHFFIFLLPIRLMIKTLPAKLCCLFLRQK